MTMHEQTTSSPNEDLALIERCLQGEDQPFDSLYARYRLPLFSYIHKLLPDNSDQVEDIFQQTWVNAVRSLKSYRHQEKFLAWLCRIAHNLAMDFFRGHDSDPVSDLAETITSNLPSPESVFSRKEFVEALDRAIATLSKEQLEVLKLRNQGVPFKDIAIRQGVSINTALGRMRYAVINLKKILSEHL